MEYLAIIIATIIWRVYDGRGYRLSEAMGWTLAFILGSVISVGHDAPTGLYNIAVSVIAFWCIIRGYDRTVDPEGWRSYRVMAWRSLPAVLILPIAMGHFWATGRFLGDFVLITAMCFAANLTQVPLRRYQLRLEALEDARRKRFIAEGGFMDDYKPGLIARYIAHFCEGWEAAWIGAAIALRGGIA